MRASRRPCKALPVRTIAGDCASFCLPDTGRAGTLGLLRLVGCSSFVTGRHPSLAMQNRGPPAGPWPPPPETLPRRLAVVRTRQAISPRLATSSLSMAGRCVRPCSASRVLENAREEGQLEAANRPASRPLARLARHTVSIWRRAYNPRRGLQGCSAIESRKLGAFCQAKGPSAANSRAVISL
jgi:hypothetical protein